MGTDCAWCGTGEGICADCTTKLFTKSRELAATGLYLSPTDTDEQASAQSSAGESESKVKTAK